MAEVAEAVEIRAGADTLQGDLVVPEHSHGTVIFAHGSGSSRLSARNRNVASDLRRHGLGTLLFDLLTTEEERIDAVTREYRFDIPLLTERLRSVTTWLLEQRPELAPVGYFGASTGAAAALVAASMLPGRVHAVVSRGGRPDLADAALARVGSATRLIVGGDDRQVLRLNELALSQLQCEKDLVVVPGATHLFEEPGALDAVSAYAAEWFVRHLGGPTRRPDA